MLDRNFNLKCDLLINLHACTVRMAQILLCVYLFWNGIRTVGYHSWNGISRVTNVLLYFDVSVLDSVVDGFALVHWNLILPCTMRMGSSIMWIIILCFQQKDAMIFIKFGMDFNLTFFVFQFFMGGISPLALCFHNFFLSQPLVWTLADGKAKGMHECSNLLLSMFCLL